LYYYSKILKKERYTYNLEVVGEYADKFEIKRFTPFSLGRGKLKKKVIQLSTKERIADSVKKDTPVTVTLRAYADEDPERVQVFRKAVFIYPRADKLK
jgi:hypothetical protein